MRRWRAGRSVTTGSFDVALILELPLHVVRVQEVVRLEERRLGAIGHGVELAVERGGDVGAILLGVELGVDADVLQVLQDELHGVHEDGPARTLATTGSGADVDLSRDGGLFCSHPLSCIVNGKGRWSGLGRSSRSRSAQPRVQPGPLPEHDHQMQGHTRLRHSRRHRKGPSSGFAWSTWHVPRRGYQHSRNPRGSVSPRRSRAGQFAHRRMAMVSASRVVSDDVVLSLESWPGLPVLFGALVLLVSAQWPLPARPGPLASRDGPVALRRGP